MGSQLGVANLRTTSRYLTRQVCALTETSLRNQEGPTSEEQGIILRIGHRMRLSGAIFGATLFLLAEANPQGINFGGSSNSKEKEEAIANGNYGQQQSSPQIQQHQNQQQCCCITRAAAVSSEPATDTRR